MRTEHDFSERQTTWKGLPIDDEYEMMCQQGRKKNKCRKTETLRPGRLAVCLRFGRRKSDGVARETEVGFGASSYIIHRESRRQYAFSVLYHFFKGLFVQNNNCGKRTSVSTRCEGSPFGVVIHALENLMPCFLGFGRK